MQPLQPELSRLPEQRVIYPPRLHHWSGQSAQEVLARYPAATTSPLKVLAVLITLHNSEHTALNKSVSFKTRQERADFLRRFFRDLKIKAGYAKLPDPRHLADKHVRAMVGVWQREKLAPATIQTYLSFLRGLAVWTDKPGFIRRPAYYGLTRDEYQRHEVADADKSWTGHGIDVDALIGQVSAYDVNMGAVLRLISAFGLRRKEALMFRPWRCVVAFEDTGLPLNERKADQYAAIVAGSKGGRPRHIAIDSPQRQAAIEHAREIVADPGAAMGRPGDTLKQAMARYMYVLAKFGVTSKVLGVTGHGLRHEVLIGQFEKRTGQPAPVRGGIKLPFAIDQPARQEIAALAGHCRRRASGAYVGAVKKMRGDKVARGFGPDQPTDPIKAGKLN